MKKTNIKQPNLNNKPKRPTKLKKTIQTIEKKQLENSLNLEFEQLKKIAKEQKLNDMWFNLDNAGLIFPATSKSDLNYVFRLSVLMKEPVVPFVLQLAINDIVSRFPSMTSAIRKGFFWFYLETPTQPLILERQTTYPCRHVPNDYRHSMIRITYFDHEISLEMFHAASDGTGGIVLLNTLIKRYLELLGHTVSDRTNCKNALDLPQSEEFEDAYQRTACKTNKAKMKEGKGYHINGVELENRALIITKGVCSCEQLKTVAKQHGATVGQLINGVFMYALQKEKDFSSRQNKLPIKLTTAVNLRTLFPSETLRNFASYMTITSSETHTLNEMIALSKTQLNEQYTKDYFLTMINLNIKGEHNFFVKILPLPLKNIALRIFMGLLGERLRTSTMSNLGLVKCPKDFENHVARYEFNLGPQYETKIALAVITYLDNTVFSFSRTIKDSLVEKYFFRELANLGIDVAVECNVEEN